MINKKSSQLKHQKRDIALLLSDNKTEKARIKVEHIIREDFLIESYELIELLCELLHERIKYLASEKHCPDDLLPAVVSLIWAIPKIDIPELLEVRKQLVAKYGKKFAEEASQNSNNMVNERLHEKLALKPPSSFLVTRYLEEIAKEYNVDWSPPSTNNSDHLPVPSPQGFSISMAPGSDLSSAYQRPVTIANLEPTYEPVQPAYYATMPTAPVNEPQVAIPIPHNDVSVILEKNNNDVNNIVNNNVSVAVNDVSLDPHCNPVKDNDNDNNNDNNPITNDETNNTNSVISNNKTDNDDNNNDNNDDNNNDSNNNDDLDELTARFNALK